MSRTKTRRAAMRYLLPRKQTTGPADRAAARIDLFTGVEKLAPKRQKAFVEVAVEDREIEEYADEEGVSPKTVANHVHLAKQDLRRLLPDYDPAL